MSLWNHEIDLFGIVIKPILSGGNIETLCKEDAEACCLYIEYNEFSKFTLFSPKQKERKKQIIAILQEKIAIMKQKQNEERINIKNLADLEMQGIQLLLFPIGVYFLKKQ